MFSPKSMSNLGRLTVFVQYQLSPSRVDFLREVATDLSSPRVERIKRRRVEEMLVIYPHPEWTSNN
jgi:hypothetical protein